ncbi:MAG: DMT family transporter [Candidatus Paceibacterota bacterium]|jgi:drug/metabolite transporter (DMT)-like permease
METTLFFLFMLPGTIALGLYDVLLKKTLASGINKDFLLSTVFMLSGAVLFLVSSFIGFPEVKTGFWFALAISVVFASAGHYAWYSAMSYRDEVSLISPLRTLTPPIVLLTGMLFLGERPTVWGILGVVVTVIGLWFLMYSEAGFAKTKLSTVLKSQGVKMGIATAVLFAISFPFDKKIVVLSSAVFSGAVSFFLIGVIVFFISSFKFREPGWGIGQMFTRKSFLFVAGLVILFSLGLVLTFEALNYSFAAYAASAKRLVAIWAVIFGGSFLKEKNINRKILAVVIMIAGTVLSVLGG